MHVAAMVAVIMHAYSIVVEQNLISSYKNKHKSLNNQESKYHQGPSQPTILKTRSI